MSETPKRFRVLAIPVGDGCCWYVYDRALGTSERCQTETEARRLVAQRNANPPIRIGEE